MWVIWFVVLVNSCIAKKNEKQKLVYTQMDVSTEDSLPQMKTYVYKDIECNR